MSKYFSIFLSLLIGLSYFIPNKSLNFIIFESIVYLLVVVVSLLYLIVGIIQNKKNPNIVKGTITSLNEDSENSEYVIAKIQFNYLNIVYEITNTYSSPGSSIGEKVNVSIDRETPVFSKVIDTNTEVLARTLFLIMFTILMFVINYLNYRR